jgi:general nucleoside transport system ATP-binding protein
MKYLEMKNINKQFGNVIANKNISFNVERGEVHTLLGENGAGKSTLMNILAGLYKPDKGEIFISGESVKITSPLKATEFKIGMIHQHFMLIQQFTVTENIILGLKSGKRSWLDIKKAENEIVELSRKYQLDIDPRALVCDLTVGYQQRVEILKALYRKSNLLVLDEPTAVFTPIEVENFLKIIRLLKEEGLAIIFISHKLSEVMDISDRITVLCRGETTGTVNKSGTNPEDLARMMVGEVFDFNLKKSKIKHGKKLLEVLNISSKEEKAGEISLKDISFNVHEGEVLGVAGVDGNGQDELAEALTGLRHVSSGKIRLSGNEITRLSVKKRIAKRIGYIPSDRLKVGLVTEFNIADNLISKKIKDRIFSKWGIFLRPKSISKHAEERISQFDIRPRDKTTKAGSLSGGNQQKLILARELSSDPVLLIAMHATRGLDIGATKFVHQQILDHRKKGFGTIYISTELDEILALSDKIAVMYKGKIMGIIKNEKSIDINDLSLMMAGYNEN